MLNIDDELKKIKKMLKETITLDKIDIVPNYDEGNKVSVKCYQKIDDKIKPVEYSFYLIYYKDKDNFANASYLLHCDYDHGLGGHSYADKYESIEDFKNTNMYQKELLTEYGRNKPLEVDDEIEIADEIEDTPTLFDETTDDIQMEELTLFDLNNEDINVSSEDNQLSLFDKIDPVDNNVDLEDLLSYGIDDYYMNNLCSKNFYIINEELNKLPKYKEYYEKLRSYLRNKLPNGTYKNTDFNNKPTFITDSKELITIKGNRQQCPIYVYKMYENNFE